MNPFGPRGHGYPLARAAVFLLALLAANLVFGLLGMLVLAAGGGLEGSEPARQAQPSGGLEPDDTREAPAAGTGVHSPGIQPRHLLLLTVAFAPFVLLLVHLFLTQWDRCPWAELFRPWAPARERGMWRESASGTPVRDLGRGYLIGSLLLLGLIAPLALAGWVTVEGWGDLARGGTTTVLGMLLLSAALFLLQGGSEEVAFRGYLFRNLGLWRGIPAALAGSSVIFGLVHGLNPGAGLLPLINTAVIGLLLALLRIRFSLWTAVGFHAAWNWILALISLPVSGITLGGIVLLRLDGPGLWTGSGFGPEASLLTTILAVVGCVVLIADPRLRRAFAYIGREGEPGRAPGP